MPGILFWIGTLVTLAGVAWLIYLAWSNDNVVMAIGIFFLAPIFGTIYALSNWDDAKIPLGLLWGGIILRVAGALIA